MKEEVKDYGEYAFRKTAKLEITPMFLDDVHRFLNDLIGKEGVGSHYLTEPRFEYVDKGTSKVKKLTKTNGDKLKRVFSLDKTMSAEPTQHLTPVGKQAMILMSMVNDVKTHNIDLGNGELLSVLREELNQGSEELTEEVK